MNKPHISASQLDMMMKCPEQWRRRYVQGEVIPPGIALIFGSTLHSVAEADLSAKIATGKSISDVEEIKQIAREAFDRHIHEDGLKLSDDEIKEGEKKVIGQAVDLSILAGEVYHNEVVPIVQPVAVEHEFLLQINGYPYNIKGFVDVVEKDGFRDLKTASKKPNQEDIDRADQYTVYALHHKAKHGVFPKEIHQDTVVKNKKPVPYTNKTERSQDDIKRLFRKLEVFSKIVESGIFHPASCMAWWCSPKWCGYYHTCKYV